MVFCKHNKIKRNFTGQNFWKITQVNNDQHKDTPKIITWCTISREEQQKCQNFAMAVERDQIKVATEKGSVKVKVECLQAYNKNECIRLLDEEKATLTTLDAGAVFNAGRYHSLVPIAQGLLEGGFNYYYAVAVIKKGTLPEVNSLYQFRGRKACFAGVETFAGWILPVNTVRLLISHNNMKNQFY